MCYYYFLINIWLSLDLGSWDYGFVYFTNVKSGTTDDYKALNTKTC